MLTKHIQTIRNHWKPNGRINKANEKELKRAIAEIIVDDISIADFLHWSGNKSRHKKLISALKLGA